MILIQQDLVMTVTIENIKLEMYILVYIRLDDWFPLFVDDPGAF